MIKGLSAFKLDSEEHLVLKFRKHWFVLLRDEFGTAFSVLLPFIVVLLLEFAGVDVRAALPPALIEFIHFWWLLIVWLALCIIWTNYYLDLWIVTDKRLVSIDQTRLFYREATTLSLMNVQDVTVEQYGIMETMLNFGTLTVQTAGPTTNNMSIRGVAQPNKIKNSIMKECEALKQRQQ